MIRTIDLASPQLARQVGEALRSVGFFVAKNHGVPYSLVQRTYAASQKFFALPDEQKLQFDSRKVLGHVGFTPYFVEQAVKGPTPNLMEYFHFRDPNHPAWKQAGCRLPPFHQEAVQLLTALEPVQKKILEACADFLGERPDLFTEMMKGGETVLRFSHYPALKGEAPKGALRSFDHEDIDFITLLPAATAEGLEILPLGSKEWLPVTAKPDEIVVNAGDMLQWITNRVFVSTTHRVANLPGERRSIVCFVHPRNECWLTPLPSCVKEKAHFPPITAGGYLQQRLGINFRSQESDIEKVD